MRTARRLGRAAGRASKCAVLGLASLFHVPVGIAQTLGGGEAIEISFVRIGAAIVVAILVAIGAALVLKRRQAGGGWTISNLLGATMSGRSQRSIKIHEMHRLGAHADLCRFSAANREYLVIVSANSAQVLAVSEAESAPSSPTEMQGQA